MLKFVHHAIRDIRTVGSIAPSSPALARAMTRSLRAHGGTRRVLEVGAGTGPFTKAILGALRTGDHFDIVEINPSFATIISTRLVEPFRAANPHCAVMVHAAAIESATLGGDYDFVICGLPFNNFPVELTRAIFARMLGLMREGAELSYFEYAAMRAIRKPFVGSRARSSIRSHEAFDQANTRTHTVTRELVLANIPPAHAVRLVKRKDALTPCSA